MELLLLLAGFVFLWPGYNEWYNFLYGKLNDEQKKEAFTKSLLYGSCFAGCAVPFFSHTGAHNGFILAGAGVLEVLMACAVAPSHMRKTAPQAAAVLLSALSLILCGESPFWGLLITAGAGWWLYETDFRET